MNKYVLSGTRLEFYLVFLHSIWEDRLSLSWLVGRICLNILQKEAPELFIFKCGMSEDTHTLQKPVEKWQIWKISKKNLQQKAHQLQIAYIAKLLRRLEQ